jgi:hypothetical protein
MSALKPIRICFLAASMAALLQPVHGLAQQSSNTQPKAVAGDGQHDFDFEIGRWKTHVSRLENPLSGSKTWVEYEGTSVVRPLWNGHANLVELEVNGPAGHIEGLSLRLYHPQSRQWSIHYANSKAGTLDPPTTGEFREGTGEFVGEDTWKGRTILVRFVISNITQNSCRFEQSFSEDGGKTWEANWIATDTRVNGEAATENPEALTRSQGSAFAADAGAHGFDFEIGDWNIHLSRLKDRLAGSRTWVAFDGTSVTQPVWNGRANVEQFETDSSGSHIEGMTLRLYNPQSHQWSIYWANSADGIIGQPMIGEFKNGVGEFYDQEMWKNRAVYVRFIWSKMATKSPHFEQAFSDDGGKTWEVNWITDQTKR